MRDIPVGNGRLLITFDSEYQIRDVYFPHVGQENHSGGHAFRFGAWADGEFSWLNGTDWTKSLRYQNETLVTDVALENPRLGLVINCNDTVASHENIFLRRIRVRDTRNEDIRSVRLFFHHDFRIYENKIGDTAFFEPATRSIIHYKKHRYFLIKTQPQFDQFAAGRKAFGEQEGTWRDAEDGQLSGTAISEGSVDSTIGVSFDLEAGSEYGIYYWIAAGVSRDEVYRLNKIVEYKRPEEFITYTGNYWKAWVNKNDTDLKALPDEVVELYKRSLLIISTQTDDEGAILAANDSDVAHRATDHYSYLWTRDGAFVAAALEDARYSEITRQFFRLCGEIVDEKGYFLQKYNPDGTVASGWHAAWNNTNGSELVPIQEDETALVLWALWKHYERHRDIDFVHRLYEQLVKRCADFMVEFRDGETGLPLPSWNLWENARGVHTFTCATVVAGLRAAANFARLFSEDELARRYSAAGDDIVRAMSEHLFSSRNGRFLRGLAADTAGHLHEDANVDASLFGLFYFGCFEADDERVAATMSAVEERLSSGGGIARFENDDYMRTEPSSVGNPWFICTLWLAEYYIALARSEADLVKPLGMLQWTASAALPSGVLAEQLDPRSGEPVSVSPLTWSHSTFVATVHSYLRKRKMLIP
jgi:oligosaccharide amylase